MGCARKECNGGTSGGEGDAPGWFVVCEYWPRGNVVGHFVENVQPELGEDDDEGAAGVVRISMEMLAMVMIGWVGVWVLYS
jgi:hypothetical protein